VPSSPWSRTRSSRTWAWTVVGDDQRGVEGQGHRDHHALAHPAGELVRVVIQALGGPGNADHAEQLDGPAAGRRAADRAVGAHGLGELPAEPVERMQAGERVLEHHADALAADLAELRAAHGQQVAPLEPGPAGDVRAGDQAEQRLGGHALARARLADDAEGLALADGERRAPDGVQRAVRGVEPDVQILDVEQRPGRAGRGRRGGVGHR
jgi:hypothetical protein